MTSTGLGAVEDDDNRLKLGRGVHVLGQSLKIRNNR